MSLGRLACPTARSLGELQLVAFCGWKKQAESSRQHIKVLYGTRTVFCCCLCRAFCSCACVLQKNRTHACILAAAAAFGEQQPRGMSFGRLVCPTARSLGELQLVAFCGWKKSRQNHHVNTSTSCMEHAPFFVAVFAALFVLALASCRRTEHMHASSQLPSLLANNGREACFGAAWLALLHEALVSSNLSHSLPGKRQAESSRHLNTSRRGMENAPFACSLLPSLLLFRLASCQELEHIDCVRETHAACAH